MALTPVGILGEYPFSTAGRSDGGDGDQASTIWERETTIVSNALSDQSFKANNDTAGESHTVSPIGQDGAKPTATQTKLGCTLAVYITDTTPADYAFFPVGITPVASSGAGGYVAHLVHNASGNLALYNTASGELGVAGAVATTPFTDNTWAYLMVTVEYTAGGTDSLRWRVWKWSSTDPRSGSWGSPIIDFTESPTGVDTGLLYMTFEASSNPKGVAQNTIYYLDDMVAFVFGSDADLPTAPFTVERLKPNDISSNGAPGAGNNQFNVSGTGTNPAAADVDDDEMDDGTTYDGNTGAGTHIQTYQLEDTNSGPFGAQDVVWTAAVSGWSQQTGANGAILFVRENGTNTAASVGGNTTTTYLTQQWVMAVAPSDSAVWTVTRINGMETGARKGNLAREVRLTITYLLVARMAGPAGGRRRGGVF